MREGSVDQSSINEQNCTQIVKGIRYTLLKTITKGKNAVSENLHVIRVLFRNCLFAVYR